MAGNVVRPLRTILTALLWPVNAGKFHKLLRVLSLSTPLKTQRSLNLGCVHMPFTTSLLCNSLKEIGATDQIFDRVVQLDTQIPHVWLPDGIHLQIGLQVRSVHVERGPLYINLR